MHESLNIKIILKFVRIKRSILKSEFCFYEKCGTIYKTFMSVIKMKIILIVYVFTFNNSG